MGLMWWKFRMWLADRLEYLSDWARYGRKEALQWWWRRHRWSNWKVKFDD